MFNKCSIFGKNTSYSTVHYGINRQRNYRYLFRFNDSIRQDKLFRQLRRVLRLCTLLLTLVVHLPLILEKPLMQIKINLPILNFNISRKIYVIYLSLFIKN